MTRAALNRMPTSMAFVVALACVLLLSGCGGGAKTGGGVKLKASGPVSTCGILGCATATPKATATKTTPTQQRTTTPPPRTQTTRPAATQKPPAPKPFNIYINGDKSGKNLIDPPQAAVYAGTTVVFHNADTVVHGVEAQNGAFNSGDIRPGGTYTWIPRVPGQYAYQDTKRPYVNAAIQVVPT